MRYDKTVNITCANCGVRGHYLKECNEPITSFGIIAFKIGNINDKVNKNLQDILDNIKLNEKDTEDTEDSDIKFLMIQRKDTMGYIDLLRGKYHTKFMNERVKTDNITTCLNEMTYSEKNSLLTKDFTSQWNEVWLNHKSRCYRNEYEEAKKKYNTLNITELVKASKITYAYTEFGFAKGRRNMKETNIMCAQREFLEETGYNTDSYEFIKNHPIITEEFLGTNNVKYKHIYYLVKMNDNIKPPKVDFNNILQSGEVQNIGWFNITECLALIRPYDIAKKNVIQQVYKDIVNMNNTFKCSNIYSRPNKHEIHDNSNSTTIY